jgi:4-alpha-glucanotransferase
MSEALDRLAQAHGIELDYISETGEHHIVSDETKRGVLRALRVEAATDDEIEASLKFTPQPPRDDSATPIDARCFMPDWLSGDRAWGITCQLYGLRSGRNWGIGDFEDLARLSELAARAGADFIGVNPLHALFFADASRYSPYAPSSRLFLNPFYIAVDRLMPPAIAVDGSGLHAARATELVDYTQVARLKRKAFEAGYRNFWSSKGCPGNAAARSFRAFCAKRGAALRRFALYEALSEVLVARGYHSGWHTWPESYRRYDSHAVRRFERENEERIAFHQWLQWVAETQLRKTHERAKTAGMRIGLYLDLAVGVAPDGADTWSQPDTVVSGVHIGAPPDMFNDQGQDWGLAPLSPVKLIARNFEPFEAMLRELMHSAGAIRIDHAMGLMRLYWIPGDVRATQGAYVRYPAGEMLHRLARVSCRQRTIVIGEDLGTVPTGFREMMSEAEIQGYRVLYFEREADGTFRLPNAYSHKALACLSTHDLPTLKGWWAGIDIDERERTRLSSPENAADMRAARTNDRVLLLAALKSTDLLPSGLEPVLNGAAPCPVELPDHLCVAAHALLARALSRLVAVQIEDLAGMSKQANLPGTVDEHPNWRRKLPADMEEIPQMTLFQDITRAVSQERPRNQ